jgi:hypothetical protein
MKDEYLKIPKEVNTACKLPGNLDATVWWYMEFQKFELLLRESGLYLCRADRLQDRFEGSYSRQQVLDMNTWLESIGYRNLVEKERQDRIRDRNRAYISCWCVSEFDLDLMWKAYVRNPPGVAVKSTVRCLQQACDAGDDLRPLDLSLVRYINQPGGEFINYTGMPEVFFCKDLHFRIVNELRIVHWPNMISPTPDHVLLPVSLPDLLISIVVAPGAPTELVRKARKNLNDVGLKSIPVEFSRDDRDMVE